MNQPNALSTLFPTTRELPFAGQFVRVGKLKLKQRAQIQAILDDMPRPNDRIRSAMSKQGLLVWPITIYQTPFLLEIDFDFRMKFLEIVLEPFNPGLSREQIEHLVEESSSDDEFLNIMYEAFGIEPKAEQPSGEPSEKKGETQPPSTGGG